MDTTGTTKKISDYLHLYLGCAVNVIAHDGIPYAPEKLTASLYHEVVIGKRFKTIKPILRPLSDMIEEEVVNLVWQKSTTYLNVKFLGVWRKRVRFEFEYKSSRRRRIEDVSFDELNPTQFLYLLKQGFDLFGLIDAGIAIDKTKL